MKSYDDLQHARLLPTLEALEALLEGPLSRHRSRSIELIGDSDDLFQNLKARLYLRAVSVAGLARASLRLGPRSAPELHAITLSHLDSLLESEDPEALSYRDLAVKTQAVIRQINDAVSA